MEWFAIVWPILSIVILYRYFSRQTVWWELILPIVFALGTIALSKFVIEKINVSDTEYIDSKIVSAEHHEPWVEKVPCSHAITNDKGQVVRYQHPFDTVTHPRKYIVRCKHGACRTDGNYYEYMKNMWNNQTTRTPFRMNALTNGDIHTTVWDEDFNKLESATFTNNYENKVQSSKSIFNFYPIDEGDKEKYSLFEYPQYGRICMKSILGYKGENHEECQKLLSKHNAILGDMRQLRVWFLIYYEQPLAAGQVQETFWKGGNRNEMVITIGLNYQNQIQWVYPFSWAKEETPKIAIRDFIASQEYLDLKTAIKYTVDKVAEEITVRDFSEFDYLETAISGWQIFFIHFLTILVCVGIGVWVVKNGIDYQPNPGKYSLTGELLKPR